MKKVSPLLNLGPRRIVIIASLLINSLNGFAATTLDEVVSSYRNSVIFIKSEKVNPANGAITEEFGSGFILNKDGYVLTSGHVVAGGAGIEVDVRGATGSSEGTLEGMEVILENTNFDYALLRFKNTGVARTPVPIGDPWSVSGTASLYVMGYPIKEEWFHTEGLLSGKVGPKGSWNTTLTLNPGMSGGPVLNNSGKVVAIVWGGVPTTGVTGINRILPINLMSDALRTAGIKELSQPAADSPPPSPEASIEVTHKIDETLESLNGPSPASRNFRKTFDAKDGYIFEKYELVQSSANNASITGFELSPDKKSLSFNFALTSGPLFDRWRGWLSASIITKQKPQN